MFTEDQQKKIDILADTVEHYSVPMAVVDYLGRQKQAFGSHDLKFVEVTEDDPERFGVRDLRHVAIYNLEVVSFNAAGRAKTP